MCHPMLGRRHASRVIQNKIARDGSIHVLVLVQGTDWAWQTNKTQDYYTVTEDGDGSRTHVAPSAERSPLPLCRNVPCRPWLSRWVSVQEPGIF